MDEQNPSPQQKREARQKIKRHAVHGVFLLDKPIGLSSNQALQKVKWLYAAQKAGHTGTLDPLATGALPICFGAATKFSSMHLDANKSYEATIKLGIQTTTGDKEGEPIAQVPIPEITQEKINQVKNQYTGQITQTPPMHSALKKDGKPLYEYARAGIEIERQPREITIHSLQIKQKTKDEIQINVNCSKGTYIRVLGEDIARALGTAGHLISLRRTQTGEFTSSQCISLEELEQTPIDERKKYLLPVESLLPHHTKITLENEDAGKLLTGMRLRGKTAGQYEDKEQIAAYGKTPHTLLGTAKTKANELIPTRLLSPQEIKEILEQN